MKNIKSLLLLVCITCLVSCSKEDPAEVEKEPFLVRGGNDLSNVDDFSVQLNASLDEKQTGFWTIVSGLLDDKVRLEDETDPNTIFHGLPGNVYELEWRVRQHLDFSSDTVTISFAPLKTWIEDRSPEFYTTRKRLEAKKYDRGLWRIEGDDYHWIWNQNWGGRVIPDEESNHIKFFGYENKKYNIIWETWYGSVSATDTLTFETSEYHQYEALERLNVLNKDYYYELDEAGNVVKLNLGGDRYGTVFDRPKDYPSLKALAHLKWLNLSGDGLHEMPGVISTYYKDLEYLNISGNHLTKLPENIGNLKKLDTLKMYNNQGGHALPNLPESFGELESLRYLEASSLGISALPESFANLTSLEYLNLEGNFIQKLPDQFGNLKNLKTFRGPALQENLPESFSQLESLTFCFFTIHHESPKLPENFGDLDNLETLWVFANLHGLPESFTQLEKIKDLEFTGATELLQEIPEDIGNLTTLEKLRIHGSFKSLPASIGDLHNLRFLHISGLLESVNLNVTRLSSLEYLNLYGMNISEIPEDIGNLKNLTHLYLGNNNITKVPESIGSLERLYKLDLSNNNIDVFPQSISQLDGHLYEFYVGGNNITEEHLEELKIWLPTTQISHWW